MPWRELKFNVSAWKTCEGHRNTVSRVYSIAEEAARHVGHTSKDVRPDFCKQPRLRSHQAVIVRSLFVREGFDCFATDPNPTPPTASARPRGSVVYTLVLEAYLRQAYIGPQYLCTFLRSPRSFRITPDQRAGCTFRQQKYSCSVVSILAGYTLQLLCGQRSGSSLGVSSCLRKATTWYNTIAYL